MAVETRVTGGTESDFRYCVFGNYIDEVLVVGMKSGSSWFNLYYAHDHLYSPVALFAANGSVVERYEYDAYGQVQFLTSNFYPLTSSQHANPYTFTGRERDTLDAGSCTLMYYRARSMDPETGRFMQRDPLGVNPDEILSDFVPNFQYADGANVYQYVRSNSMAYADPFGLHGPPWAPPWAIGIPDHIVDPEPQWKDIFSQTVYEDFSWIREYYGKCTKEKFGIQYSEYGLFETTRTNITFKTWAIPLIGVYRNKTEWHYGVADVYIMTCECAGGAPAWVSRKQNHKSSEMFYKRVVTRQKRYHNYMPMPSPYPKPPGYKPPIDWV
jgi:RHS repeat-associated protein